MDQVRAGELFFVYGSMTQGSVHFRKIQEFILSSREATTRARAYRLQVGFPVMIEEGEDPVPGELVEIQSSDFLMGLLDQFHGFDPLQPDKSLYWRRRVEVRCGLRTLEAWAYFMNPRFLPRTARPIEDGDWRESLSREPALTEKLTDRQKDYIRKLGTVSGRATVPVEMDLYRELLKLEIIIDKGRRLALSKLGHEVFRYLS